VAVAIVAIPVQDDSVWQISSQKVPHLTFLALRGDQLDNLGEVEKFISQVVGSSLREFTLNVDRHGVLGADAADVLFFSGPGISKLRDFRAQLLKNPDIRKAYDAMVQFPDWSPHLTLGFPKTPAKIEDPGTKSVTFDRIALWTGDFEGVEFQLKTDPTDAFHTSSLGENFFRHFGVKGMKWGQHRSTMDKGATAVEVHAKAGKQVKVTGGKHHPPHEDAIKAAISKQKARKSTTASLSNKELQDLVSRLNLEQQYSRLIATDPGAASDVQKFLKKASVVGKTVNDVHTFLNSPAGKLAKAALKEKLKR
jgi:hypothetical protein